MKKLLSYFLAGALILQSVPVAQAQSQQIDMAFAHGEVS